MPANEFEKKLQQRMGELKLTPSNEVWIEVEHRIRKEKKKRRAFFWLPLLFLMLGGGLATILLTNKKNNDNVHSHEQLNNPQSTSSTQKQQPIDKTTFLNNIAEKKAPKKNKSTEFTIREYSNNHVEESFINKKRFIQKNNEQVKPAEKETIQLKEAINNNIVGKDKPEKQNNEAKIGDSLSFNQPINQQKDTIASKEIVVENKENKQVIQQADQPIKDSTANITTQSIRLKKRSGKWQWGILLEKGESHTAKGLQFIGSSATFDAFSNFNASAAGANPNPAGPVYSPSAKRPSGSFGAGIFAKKNVSSRFDVNFSLGYSYLSTKMDVGKKVDSSFTVNNSSSFLGVTNYYRASNISSSSYTNRYHFLSLSTELSWKIISGKKLNIYWNNGVSYNRLLSSNALNYDRNLQGYYKDFGLLIHNHFFLSTSLSAPVFKRFDINPFAEYSLTPLLRHSGSARTHFSSYGIRVHFLLKKK